MNRLKRWLREQWRITKAEHPDQLRRLDAAAALAATVPRGRTWPQALGCSPGDVRQGAVAFLGRYYVAPDPHQRLALQDAAGVVDHLARALQARLLAAGAVAPSVTPSGPRLTICLGAQAAVGQPFQEPGASDSANPRGARRNQGQLRRADLSKSL